MLNRHAILYTTCYLDISGVTRINFDILKYLKEKGFDIHVCVTDDDSHLINNWDFLFQLSINKPFKLRSSKRNFLEVFIDYLVQNNIECIFNTHSLWVYKHCSLIKKQIPHIKIVDSLHVLEPYCFRGGYPDISANKHVQPFIDRSIVISDDLRNYILSNYTVTPSKLIVVRNGINTEKFSRRDDVRGKFKIELGLTTDNTLIGFIGRMTEQKRPLLFLEIAYEVAIRNKNCFFYMIGEGHLSERAIRFINKSNLHGRIFLIRQRNDIDYIFNSTDIIIQPSAYEGAPLTVLEALSTGVSVISSDVGAIREYVGSCCTLIPRTADDREKELFVRATLEQLSSPPDSEHTSSYIRRKYDVCETSSQYGNIILETIGIPYEI